MIQSKFSSRVRLRTLRFLFRDCRSFYFHSSIKSTFPVSKGLLCVYDKQNNTWLLVDMKFLFSCSTRHPTHSLRSLVSYRIKWSEKNSHPCIILYLLYNRVFLSWIRVLLLVVNRSGFCHTDRFHGNGHKPCIFILENQQMQNLKLKPQKGNP